MPKNIKSITNPKLKLEILTPAEVKKIHDATLWIIENVGVRFPSERALDIRAANGARVDRPTKVVKAKAELIESALKTCPPAYRLAARNPDQDLPLDGNHVFVGTDGCGVEVIDLQSGQRRTSRLRDVAEISRLADATEEVAFHWVPVSAPRHPGQGATGARWTRRGGGDRRGLRRQGD
jgi:trimethylamine--corrinoid protein Co-methyltransferase